MDMIAFTPDIAQVIDANAQIEVVATGFAFTEGPVWDGKRERLIFSDIPANRQYQWREEGGATLFREPTGNSNGLTIDMDGFLLNAEHAGRRISRLGLDDGSLVPIATHYDGKRLNSPNDLVVHSSGAVYFTDPPYGVAHEARELDFQGVFRLDPDGTVSLLVDDFDRPNGIAFNADESILYVDDTSRQHVRAFGVQEDGSLDEGRVFAEMDPSIGKGVPDGLKVDVAGNVYVTGPAGVWIFSPSGRALAVLKVPEVTANLAWGGADKQTLFMTASTSVYRVRTRIPGVRRF